jgi:hypothetical protein
MWHHLCSGSWGPTDTTEERAGVIHTEECLAEATATRAVELREHEAKQLVVLACARAAARIVALYEAREIALRYPACPGVIEEIDQLIREERR